MTTHHPKTPSFLRRESAALAAHPPYSPDVASSDFVLFGHIKHCLQGIAFPPREELLAAIHEIVGTIPRPTLEDVFRHWMERFE
jgi:hypothetical protein